MEIFETIILFFLYFISLSVIIFIAWKIFPLIYRELKAHVKIMEKKAERIEQDEADETITII